MTNCLIWKYCNSRYTWFHMKQILYINKRDMYNNLNHSRWGGASYIYTLYCASMNTFLNIFLTIFIQQFKLLVRNSEKPICDCAFCTFMYHLRKIWTWKIKMMRQLVYHWIWYSNHCGQFHLFLRWDKIKTLSTKNKWIIQLSNEEV